MVLSTISTLRPTKKAQKCSRCHPLLSRSLSATWERSKVYSTRTKKYLQTTTMLLVIQQHFQDQSFQTVMQNLVQQSTCGQNLVSSQRISHQDRKLSSKAHCKRKRLCQLHDKNEYYCWNSLWHSTLMVRKNQSQQHSTTPSHWRFTWRDRNQEKMSILMWPPIISNKWYKNYM